MLTLEALRRTVEVMKDRALPANTVQTTEQAQQMTENDPSGHQWVVGEQYYELPFSPIGH